MVPVGALQLVSNLRIPPFLLWAREDHAPAANVVHCYPIYNCEKNHSSNHIMNISPTQDVSTNSSFRCMLTANLEDQCTKKRTQNLRHFRIIKKFIWTNMSIRFCIVCYIKKCWTLKNGRNKKESIPSDSSKKYCIRCLARLKGVIGKWSPNSINSSTTYKLLLELKFDPW